MASLLIRKELPISYNTLLFHSFAAVRDHADRVINKWRAIIEGNAPKDGKPASAAAPQKRLSAGGGGNASEATSHSINDEPPTKKAAPVKTAPSQFRDTGTFKTLTVLSNLSTLL